MYQYQDYQKKKSWTISLKKLILVIFFFIIIFILLGYSEENIFNKNENWKKTDNRTENIEDIFDLIIQENVKKELKNWDNFKKLSLFSLSKESSEFNKIDNIIFYGPPGTGKTFISEEIAKVFSFYYKEADFSTVIFAGSSEKKQKDLFDEAKRITKKLRKGKKENKTEIFVTVLLNEIDSIAQRSSGLINSHKDGEATSLMKNIDDVYKNYPEILLIGTTNRIESIDEALLRPGRFTRKIFVPYITDEKEIELMIDKLRNWLNNCSKTEENKEKWKNEHNDHSFNIGNNFWEEIKKDENTKKILHNTSFIFLLESFKKYLSSNFEKNSFKSEEFLTFLKNESRKIFQKKHFETKLR